VNYRRPSFVVMPRFLEPWFSRPDGGVFKKLADNGAHLFFWDGPDTLDVELDRLDQFLNGVTRERKIQ
jgi:hypothetical protein